MPPDPIRERVLLVEDDDMTAEIVLSSVVRSSSLRDARGTFQLTRVASLGEALDALADGEFGGVLLDLYLPDSAGLDTVHAVLQAAPHIPVIVLTSTDDSDMALEAMRLGAQDYLFKGRIDGALIVRSLLYSISRHRAEHRLRNAQQMEALGRLAGSVAHDFNNLLTVIIGNAQTVQGDAEPGSDIADALLEIQHAAQRAAALTGRLLALGRQQQFQPRAMDLGEALLSMDGMLRRVVGADTAFAMRLPEDHLIVHADPMQVEQLVLNLVMSARDASPPARRITIELSPLAPDVAGAWRPRLGTGRYACIAVSDDGARMDPDALRRMYEPFSGPSGSGSGTGGRGTGTGLALSIVTGIVEQSGGSMYGESTEEHGTRFYVALPLESEMMELDERSTPVEAPGDDDALVLLVEDESSLRSLARRVLERGGFRVLEATNGAEALALFDERGDEVALLLTDVVMPGMRGPELVHLITARRPGLPVLFMSGYADDELVRRGVFPDHVSLLKKPFSPEELVGHAREHIRRVRGTPRSVGTMRA